MLIELSEFDIRLLYELLSDTIDDIHNNMIYGCCDSYKDLERLKFIEKFLNKLESDN